MGNRAMDDTSIGACTGFIGCTGGAIAASWKCCFVDRCRLAIAFCATWMRGTKVRGREVGWDSILAGLYPSKGVAVEPSWTIFVK